MDKMLNPEKAWFVWGVSAKKKFIDDGSSFDKLTYYGVSAINSLFLNGRESVDADGNIRREIDVTHFRITEGEFDIYLDCDQGILRLCVVGQIEKNLIVEITGLNQSGNDAIKRALKQGLKYGEENNTIYNANSNSGGDEDLTLKIELVAPPLFTVSVSTYEPEKGITLVDDVVKEINKSITESKGTMTIKQNAQVIAVEE